MTCLASIDLTTDATSGTQTHGGTYIRGAERINRRRRGDMIKRPQYTSSEDQLHVQRVGYEASSWETP